jgi:hypothetical protein
MMVITDIAGKEYIDMDESRCFCRDYQVSKSYIGPIGNSVTMPIKHCNLVVGYSPADYARFTTFLEWVRMQIKSKKEPIHPEDYR